MEKISEYRFAFYYWLKVDLKPSEFSNFVENMDKIKELELVDGVDMEDQSICFRFNKYKPTKIQEVKFCKLRNEQLGKRFLQDLSKKLDGRLYFNVNSKIIKRKND